MAIARIKIQISLCNVIEEMPIYSCRMQLVVRRGIEVATAADCSKFQFEPAAVAASSPLIEIVSLTVV